MPYDCALKLKVILFDKLYLSNICWLSITQTLYQFILLSTYNEILGKLQLYKMEDLRAAQA